MAYIPGVAAPPIIWSLTLSLEEAGVILQLPPPGEILSPDLAAVHSGFASE